QLAGVLAAARREFIAEARQGRGGRGAQATYAAQMDALLGQLGEGAPHHTSQALTVCALGGYGRRTLCLHSDVDLLIVFENELARGEERFVNAVLQPLWDLQLVVGHQVRELCDFAPDNPDLENPEFLFA